MAESKKPVPSRALRAKRIAKRLNKAHGAGTFVNFKDASSNVKKRLDTGNIILNLLLSGSISQGIASGRMYEFYGEEQIGKSTLGCCVAAAIQKKYDGVTCIIDTESTMTRDRALSLGLDEDALLYSEEIFVEDILHQTKDFIEALGTGVGVLFWDTVAVSRSKLNDNRRIGRGRRAEIAGPLSEGLARIAKPLAKSNCVFIACNQLKTGNVDGGSFYTTKRKLEATKGGLAMKFHTEARLRFTYSTDAYRTTKGKKKLFGFVVNVNVRKNKSAPCDVGAKFLFQTRGKHAGNFNMALSCLLTAIYWDAVTKSSSGGSVVFEKKKYSFAKWEAAYDSDAAFRLRVHAALQDAYDKQVEKEPTEDED